MLLALLKVLFLYPFLLFPVALIWSHTSFSVWKFVTCCIHSSFFKRTWRLGYFLSFPCDAGFVCLWHVECIVWHLQFSMAYCFLIMVWGFCSVDLPSAAVVVFSNRVVLCPRHCQASSPPFFFFFFFSTRDVALRRLNRLRVTLPLISMHESSREGSQPSLFREEQEAAVHSCSGWSLSCFHWGRRAWVQLSVSGLMDGLSDFIWAGRTLRWLHPRDCHSWLLYQGLTYRAVILLEQGSQAPRPAIPPLLSVTLPPTDLGLPACLLDWPDACLPPTQGQIH